MFFNNGEQRCFMEDLKKYLKMPEKEVAEERLLSKPITEIAVSLSKPITQLIV